MREKMRICKRLGIMLKNIGEGKKIGQDKHWDIIDCLVLMVTGQKLEIHANLITTFFLQHLFGKLRVLLPHDNHLQNKIVSHFVTDKPVLQTPHLDEDYTRHGKERCGWSFQVPLSKMELTYSYMITTLQKYRRRTFLLVVSSSYVLHGRLQGIKCTLRLHEVFDSTIGSDSKNLLYQISKEDWVTTLREIPY